MKKYLVLSFLLGLLAVAATPFEAQAAQARQHRIGDIGFHGGISESRHLPRTTETILLEQGNSRNNNNSKYRKKLTNRICNI